MAGCGQRPSSQIDHGGDRAPEVVANRPKSGINRQSDTAQMKAFPRRVFIGILWHGRLLGSRVGQTSGVLRPLNTEVVSCKELRLCRAVLKLHIV